MTTKPLPSSSSSSCPSCDELRSELSSIYDFSDSIGSTDDLDALFWRMAEDIAAALSLEDCVLYLREGENLVQKGAFGVKAQDHKVMAPIEIAVGSGIVGTCAATAKSQIVDDVSQFPGYIPDQFEGASELCVPVIYENRVIGVFDSESSRLGAYSARDCDLLEKYSRLAAPRIVAALQRVKLEEFVVSLVEEREQLLDEDLAKSGRAPLPGQTIGAFHLERLLALTDASTLWVAEEKKLNRKVCLKILHRGLSDEKDTANDLEQVQAGSRLHHPGIAEIYSCGENEGWFWTSQEHVQNGQLLATFLESISRLPHLPEHYFELIVGLFQQAARSLIFAHGEGVSHGTICPEVIVVRQGEQPKFLGFGRPISPGDSHCQEADTRALVAALYRALTFREVDAESYLAPSMIRPECPPWLDELCGSVLNTEQTIPSLQGIADSLRSGSQRGSGQVSRSVFRNWLAKFSAS